MLCDIVEDVARSFGVEVILGELIRGEVGNDELRLIVEHLFKVRDMPELVDAVAMETAGQMVVHAAFVHLAKRVLGHHERLLSHGLLGVGVDVEETSEDDRSRELRRFAKATKASVVLSTENVEEVAKHLLAERRALVDQGLT